VLGDGRADAVTRACLQTVRGTVGGRTGVTAIDKHHISVT